MKTYLLVGYGVSNSNVYNFLKKRRKKILIYDDNPVFLPKKIKKITVTKESIPFKEILWAIVSPGIWPKTQIIQYLTENNIKIITDLDLLYLHNKNKKINSYYLGLTGTNGKTTTVQLINKLLGIPNLLCGNIGQSIFAKTKKIKGHTIYVIELSSYQLHYIQYIKFNLGIIINIEQNHDEWHGSFNAYKQAKEKLKIISNVFINFQSPYNRSWHMESQVLFYNSQTMFQITNPVLLSKHNSLNLLNTLEIVNIIYKKFSIYTYYIPLYNIQTFQGSEYRQQIIYNKNNLIVVNDSKSTNLASTKAAIENYIDKKYSITLLLGGIIKGDLNLLSGILKYIDNIILFGPRIYMLQTYLRANNYEKFTLYNTLGESIQNISYIHQSIQSLGNINNKVIIFSPGGASFDEFKNYIDRGLFFTKNILLKM